MELLFKNGIMFSDSLHNVQLFNHMVFQIGDPWLKTIPKFAKNSYNFVVFSFVSLSKRVLENTFHSYSKIVEGIASNGFCSTF